MTTPSLLAQSLPPTPHPTTTSTTTWTTSTILSWPSNTEPYSTPSNEGVWPGATPLQATQLWQKVAREWAQERMAKARAHHPTTRIRIRRAVEKKFREDEWERLTLSPPPLSRSGQILTTTTTTISAADNARIPSHTATASPFLCAPAWFRLPTPTAVALRQRFPEETRGEPLYCMTGPRPKTLTTTTSTTEVAQKKKTTKKPRFPSKP